MALCGGWCSGNLMVNESSNRTQSRDPRSGRAIRRAQGTHVSSMPNAPTPFRADHRTQPSSSQRPKLTRDTKSWPTERSFRNWRNGPPIRGLFSAITTTMGAMVQDAEDIDWLMEGSSEDLTLLYDTGHLHFAGADPLAVLDKWGHRVHHVHFKDVRQPVLDWVRAEDKSSWMALPPASIRCRATPKAASTSSAYPTS